MTGRTKCPINLEISDLRFPFRVAVPLCAVVHCRSPYVVSNCILCVLHIRTFVLRIHGHPSVREGTIDGKNGQRLLPRCNSRLLSRHAPARQSGFLVSFNRVNSTPLRFFRFLRLELLANWVVTFLITSFASFAPKT
jgi:hypothetical protein